MEEKNKKKYAQCLADVPHLGTRTFSYLIPDFLKDKIKIGQAVSVPFGNRKQNVAAFVTGFSDYLEEGIKAKPIDKIIDTRCVFTLDYLKFLDWIAAYYCCDINTVIQAAVPMKFLKENSKQKELTEKYIIFKTKEGAAKRQFEILEKLEQYKEAPLIEFEREVKAVRKTLLNLKEKGFADIIEKAVYRSPLAVFKNIKQEEFPELSAEQQNAFDIIAGKIDKKQPCTLLLNGITGSGKTEIYMRAMQKVLDEGRNILFLAPEIALASQLTMRIMKRFNPDETALWHSSISEGEKYDVWNRLRDNKIRIIIGARSAVFAPLNNIGLIITDEEHENTYKQTAPAPRYDARKAAEKIAELNNAVLIKGSATPDISSYYKAISEGSLITLTSRFNNAALAGVSIVDMREEFYKGNRSIFSNALINAVNETLDKGKQVLLLMNRRGFYTYIQCRNCAEVIECDNCGIPMVYHASDKTLKCHWCGSVKKLPDKCPKCSSGDILMSGAGTQRIEDITAKLFPNAVTARIDSDVLTKKTEYINILEKFQNGNIDILIGTQMIAKGLDNKNTILAGVIDADLSFNMPDFRSSERGFQLLMQTAGRSGRGADEGRVIFQTSNPEFYAVQNAKEQNYEAFYKNEIERRRMFEYPPFSQIIKIVISSKNEMRAFECAEETAVKLKEQFEKFKLAEYIDIKGAVKCLMYKINSEYRFQIIIKNKLGKRGHCLVSSFMKSAAPADDIKLIIDIDPVDIM